MGAPTVPFTASHPPNPYINREVCVVPGVISLIASAVVILSSQRGGCQGGVLKF